MVDTAETWPRLVPLPSPGHPGSVAGQMSRPHQLVAFAGLLRNRRRPAAVDRAARSRAVQAAEVARRTVPHYRDLYGAGVITSLVDVPVTDKSAMIRVPREDRMSAEPPHGSRWLRTTGTTGVPLEVVYSPRFARWQGLLALRSVLEMQLGAVRRHVALSMDPPDRTSARRLAFAATSLPSSMPDEEVVRHLIAVRPRSIRGWPHRLLQLSEQLPDQLPPMTPITHGETLDPTLREALRRAFGRPPIDWYGTTEVGAVAAQCRAVDLYHVNNESVVLEVLDDGVPVPPGGTGDVVVTGLHNPLMPMIRYRMHDRVTLAERPCGCGYRGQALVEVLGRTIDVILGTGGEPVWPERLFLRNHLDRRERDRYVRRYQVHQSATGDVEVRMELHQPLPAALADAIVESYGAIAGGRQVTLGVVDDLGDDAPGRFRLVRSDLAAPSADG